MQARCWPRSLDRGRLWPRRVDWSIHSQRLELCTYHLTGFCCQQLKYWSIPDRMKSFFGNRHGHVPLFQQSVLEAVSKRSGCRKAQSKWGQCMEDVSIEWRDFGVQSKFSDDLQLTSGEVAWRSLDSSSPKQRKIWWSHPERKQGRSHRRAWTRIQKKVIRNENEGSKKGISTNKWNIWRDNVQK